MSLRGRVRHYADEPAARAAMRARIQRPYRVARFHSFGKGSIVHRPQWIYGAHHIVVGDYVMIMPGVWLAAERGSWDRPAPALTIGDGTAIRSNCVLSATESVTIEGNVLIAGSCTIIDSDHTVGGGRNPLHNPTLAAPVRIGAGTWLGERVTVLRGSDIGRECLIGAHSVVRGTIADHSIAVGAPARVVGSTLEDDGGYSPA